MTTGQQGYTRSADTRSYSRVNSFIFMGTTGRKDGFRAAGIHPVASSTGTVTNVYGAGGGIGLRLSRLNSAQIHVKRGLLRGCQPGIRVSYSVLAGALAQKSRGGFHLA
jgi:hypothetical protein